MDPSLSRDKHVAIDLSNVTADTAADNLGFFDSVIHDGQERGI